jgi:hypothetical protein
MSLTSFVILREAKDLIYLGALCVSAVKKLSHA